MTEVDLQSGERRLEIIQKISDGILDLVICQRSLPSLARGLGDRGRGRVVLDGRNRVLRIALESVSDVGVEFDSDFTEVLPNSF